MFNLQFETVELELTTKLGVAVCIIRVPRCKPIVLYAYCFYSKSRHDIIPVSFYLIHVTSSMNGEQKKTKQTLVHKSSTI